MTLKMVTEITDRMTMMMRNDNDERHIKMRMRNDE